MGKPTDDRILGLSPRARRFVVAFLAISAILIALSYIVGNRI